MSEKVNKGGLTLTKASIIVFVLILFVLAKDDIAKLYHKLAMRLGRERPAFATNAWTRWNFGEMSFEAPFGFKTQQHMMPQNMSNVYADLEDFEGNDPYDCFHVSVIGGKFKTIRQYDFDFAIKAAVNGVAARFGDSSPVFSSEPVKVGETEMRRVSYKKDFRTRTIHIDALFARRGPKLWMVLVAYFADDAQPDAQRILSSLRVVR